MKKKRDNDVAAKILAVISEGRKTTGEIAEAMGRKPGAIQGATLRLRDAGKIVQEAKGEPWRLAGGSPIPESDEPEPASTRNGRAARGALQMAIAQALRGGPTSHAMLQEDLPVQFRGRKVSVALAHMKASGRVARDGQMWRLLGEAAPVTPSFFRKMVRGVEKATRAEYGAETGRSHPVLGPLYDQRDRLDRAIAILEGRA